MGAAPSAEILSEAPYRTAHGGVRQVALIPIVEQYFPTPDCPLFQQLYDAYTDPSVRYYMRPDFDGDCGDLSRIPPIVHSTVTLHRLLMRYTAHGVFPSNAAIREVYAVGDFYRIRPVLCAIVFLYEGTTHNVPPGSVQLGSAERGGTAVFVKVIGIIGDTCTLTRQPEDPLIPFKPDDVLRIRTFIMKSAGDHNMSRVVLLAAFVYYHQCCHMIGLPNVPALAANFTCFKTNIPFLCFLREMRDRAANVLDGPPSSKFFIDEFCLHGELNREYVAKMMPAFAAYYINFLDAKSEQRALKQQAHHHQHLTGETGGRDRAGVSLCRAGSCVGSEYPQLGNCSAVAVANARNDGNSRCSSSSGAGCGTVRITYVVKGYITRPKTTLSSWSHAPNEVYVVCVDSTITVVDCVSVEAPDGPTPTPLTEQTPSGKPADNEAMEGTQAGATTVGASGEGRMVERFTVRRGDILSFYVPKGRSRYPSVPSLRTAEAVEAAAAADAPEALFLRSSDRQAGPEGEEGVFFPSTPRLDAFDFDSSSSFSSSIAGASSPTSPQASPAFPSTSPHKKGETTTAAATTAMPGDVGQCAESVFIPQKGSWFVDETVYIENVLLSLVRDECKLAREATEQDPGWVYDEVRHSLVHDGSFYVWHFSRGAEDFFYGTVPKFANPNRLAHRNGGKKLGHERVDHHCSTADPMPPAVGGRGALGLHGSASHGKKRTPQRTPSTANAGSDVDLLDPSSSPALLPPPPPHHSLLNESPPPSLPPAGATAPYAAVSLPSAFQTQEYWERKIGVPQPPCRDAAVTSMSSPGRIATATATTCPLPPPQLLPPPSYSCSVQSSTPDVSFSAVSGSSIVPSASCACAFLKDTSAAFQGGPLMYACLPPAGLLLSTSQAQASPQTHAPYGQMPAAPRGSCGTAAVPLPFPTNSPAQGMLWGVGDGGTGVSHPSLVSANRAVPLPAAASTVAPSIVACVMNAQGQLIPIGSVMQGGVIGGAAASAQPSPLTYATLNTAPPSYGGYVSSNGQLSTWPPTPFGVSGMRSVVPPPPPLPPPPRSSSSRQPPLPPFSTQLYSPQLPRRG